MTQFFADKSSKAEDNKKQDDSHAQLKFTASPYLCAALTHRPQKAPICLSRSELNSFVEFLLRWASFVPSPFVRVVWAPSTSSPLPRAPYFSCMMCSSCSFGTVLLCTSSPAFPPDIVHNSLFLGQSSFAAAHASTQERPPVECCIPFQFLQSSSRSFLRKNVKHQVPQYIYFAPSFNQSRRQVTLKLKNCTSSISERCGQHFRNKFDRTFGPAKTPSKGKPYATCPSTQLTFERATQCLPTVRSLRVCNRSKAGQPRSACCTMS